jgi:hypothetical protein
MIDTLRRSPGLLALALVALVLAVVLAAELRFVAPSARDAAPKGARAVEAKLLPPIPARPPEQAYPEVAARPLFISTRRPAPELAAAPAQNMVRGQFTLHGVIVRGDQRTAMLREKSTGKVLRAEAGREVNGLKVAEIQPESVTLVQGDEREVVPLLVQRGSTVAAVPGVPGAPVAAGMVPAANAGAGPFARSGANLPSNPAAQNPAGAMPVMPGQPQQQQAQGAPANPAFGPPPPGSTPSPSAATAPPAPQSAPAFPMSPEELLARRRARRAQQNQ